MPEQRQPVTVAFTVEHQETGRPVKLYAWGYAPDFDRTISELMRNLGEAEPRTLWSLDFVLDGHHYIRFGPTLAEDHNIAALVGAKPKEQADG